MPKYNGVGDLHHRRLEVQRKKNAVLCSSDLLIKKLTQFLLTQGSRINQFPRTHRDTIGQRLRLTIYRPKNNTQCVVGWHCCRFFRAVEVAILHMRNMRFGVARPSSH